MKSLAELEEIKKEALKDMILRKGKTLTKIMIGMNDCGIKAGAKDVMDLFVKEVAERGLDAVVMMTDCQGMCDREPVVKIINKDGSIVLYANVTTDKVNQIIEEHIINGNVCKDLLA